jgi:hypothetical protein
MMGLLCQQTTTKINRLFVTSGASNPVYENQHVNDNHQTPARSLKKLRVYPTIHSLSSQKEDELNEEVALAFDLVSVCCTTRRSHDCF